MPERWLPTIQATGSITDPEILVERTYGAEAPRVVARDTRLDLFGGQVVLLFTGSKFIPFTIPEPQDRFPYYPLWYFLIYRTRVQYNLVSPDRLESTLSLQPSEEVTFTLDRLIEVSREETIDGRVERFWHHETEPYSITVAKMEFEDLLRLCTRELYLSFAYYLTGCENPRYFLIEFFKAIEVIENAFGGEKNAISALRDHGVVASEFKRLKRCASDQQHPFDVGRHAPRGSDLHFIDVRRLLEEPLSRQIFRESVGAARQAIDVYFSFLRAASNR